MSRERIPRCSPVASGMVVDCGRFLTSGAGRVVATRRRRTWRGYLPPSCEGLEARRLLAGDAPVGSAEILSSVGTLFSIAPQASPAATERTDFYVTPASWKDYWPTARIEIHWVVGPNSLNGRIVVRDDQHRVQLDAPLVRSTPFDQSVMISGMVGMGSPSSLLRVRVEFDAGSASDDGPGSYRLDVEYPPPQSPQELYPPGWENHPPDPRPVVITPPPFPSLTFGTSVTLPTYPEVENSPAGPPGPPANPVGPFPFPGGTTPVATGPPVGSSHHLPSVVGLPSGWGGTVVPLPASEPSPGRATTVGPLPLGSSIEDGGILARSRSQTGPVVETGDRGVRPTVATWQEVIATDPHPGPPRLPDPAAWLAEPDVPAAPNRSEILASAEAVATGVAFLPPIPLVAPPEPRDRQSVAERSPPGPEPKRPRLSALMAAALVGSTTLVLHLARLDQGGIAGWRRARSSKDLGVGRSHRSRTNRRVR